LPAAIRPLQPVRETTLVVSMEAQESLMLVEADVAECDQAGVRGGLLHTHTAAAGIVMTQRAHEPTRYAGARGR
jgi:hypothetical protein